MASISLSSDAYPEESALTSPHAAGEATGGHDGARGDSAPGDSGNGATGEHIGGGTSEVGWWYRANGCLGEAARHILSCETSFGRQAAGDVRSGISAARSERPRQHVGQHDKHVNEAKKEMRNQIQKIL